MHQRLAVNGERGVHVRFIVIIHRRVHADPKHIGVHARGLGIGREGKFFGGDSGGDQFVQSRLEQRRLPRVQPRDISRVHPQPDDRKMFRATRRRDAAEVPEALDNNFHLHESPLGK